MADLKLETRQAQAKVFISHEEYVGVDRAPNEKRPETQTTTV